MKVKVSTYPTQAEFEEVDLSLTTKRGSECLIGRSPDSDLVLNSDDVSRLHGKFFSQGGHYYFCDVGSRNGSIVNGKLAEKGHSYILKNGDIIRIGDFVLMMEDEIQSSQEAETVVRIINPSVFSNWRPQSESVVPQESKPAINQSTNELVSSQIPAAEVSQTDLLKKEEIVNTSEEVEQTEQEIEQVEQSEPTFIQPEDIITPDSAILETQESNEASEQNDEPTVVQLGDVNQDHDATTDIEYQTENVLSTEHDSSAPDYTDEYTIVQTHDIVSPEHEHQTDVLSTEHDSPAPDYTDEYTIVQTHDIVSQDHDAATNIEDQTDVLSTEHGSPAPDYTDEYTIVQTHDIVNQDIVSQDHDAATIAENETENVATTEHGEETSEEDNINLDAEEIAAHTHEHETEEAINQDEEARDIEAISSDIENVEVDTPSQQVEEVVSELVAETASISTPELQSEDIATSDETEEVPPETQEPEELEEAKSEQSYIQLAKILEEKQIVLVSHDSKKSELTELVAEHEEFLSYCLTRTWHTFSDDLYKQTGFNVTQEIPPPTSGGYQAINSLVNSGEILAVIFLRDLMTPQPGQASEEALLRICNINNVLLATNLPTARAILHYLKNLKD